MEQDIEPRRILVTGAVGFIASHLLPVLAATGCEPVLLWSSAAAPGQAPSEMGLHCHDVDICDYRAVEDIFLEERPTAVIHLAGVRGRGAQARRFRDCVDVNIGGTTRVLEAGLHAGVKRIVIMGSAEEYGQQSGPQNEQDLVQPRTLYGASKAAATALALCMHVDLDCPVVVLRPFTVYGPGQPADMFVAQAIDCAVGGKPFRMTEGKQKRDLVYVTDLVDALIKAATVPGIDGQVINVGSGRATALREVAERIWKISGSSAPLEIGARSATSGELVDTWAEVDKASSLLGWTAGVDLDRGLTETIAAARKASREVATDAAAVVAAAVKK